MAADDNKDPGQTPAPGLFTTTHWSIVKRALEGSAAALNSLFQTYRDPLLVWLRARHYSSHDAEDLLHDFFAALLRRDFLSSVNQKKGKFRSFLLTSLKNHLHDYHDKEIALKRGSGKVPESLQETDALGQPLHDPATTDAAPDLEYDRAWWRTVQTNALRQLEAECARTGHASLCAALEPVLFADETASSYREIGERLGMTEGAVSTAAHRIRARLKGILIEILRQTVDNQEDLREELLHLASLFEK